MASDERRSEPAVLVVDGDPKSREFVASLLREEGFPVLVAERGDEALGIVARDRVSLVVADADTPDLDLGRLAEARAAADDPPLLLLSARLPLDLNGAWRRARVADALQKPVDAGELLLRVRRILRSGGAGPAAVWLPSRAWTGDEEAFRGCIPDILFAIPAWFLVVGGDLRVRFANQSLLEFLGRSFSDVAGTNVEESVTARITDGALALSTIRTALAEGRENLVRGIRVGTPAGAVKAVDVRATPLDLPGGRHVLVLFHDVTEHHRAREVSREEKQKLEEIVNGMGASLAVLGPDLTVTWTNRTFRDWFGEMWGKRFHHALRGLVIGTELDPGRIFTDREYVSREWAHLDGAGNRRYFRNVILPSRDPAGGLKELVLVIQDLTEVTLRSEQHRMLRDLTNLLQSTLELERLLYIILTCLTAGHALGFNRAFVLLADREGRRLEGRMGVGPSTREEAFTIWADLAASRKSLMDLTTDYEEFRAREPGPLTRLVREVRYPLEGEGVDREIAVLAARSGTVQIVRDAWTDPRVTPEFRERFGSREFVCAPLVSKGRAIGVVVVDNVFSERPVSEEQAGMLELFSGTAGLALDNARAYAELKDSMEALKKAQAAAIQAERLATVGRLAAHVAHEIRNPLVAIGGFAAGLLRHPEEPERVRRAAGIIHEEVLRLESILSGVMDFTRPARLEPVPGNVNPIVRQVVDPLQEQLREKGIRLDLDLPPVPDCRVDGKSLHQAVLNLVKNSMEALAAGRSGGDAPWIAIRTRATPDEIQVEVEDNGGGIPPDLHPVLFEPFISRRTGGTGLGLAVVRKILLDHGGDAREEGLSGAGAKFVLVLPRGEPVA